MQSIPINYSFRTLQPGRFLGAYVLILVFLVTTLPVTAVVVAGPSTGLEASAPALPDETPTPTPTPSEEELRLQEQKKLLELQRDVELAKKAIRDAQPQPAAPVATPLAGDTTLSEVRLEPEIVSYNAMSGAAEIISQELQTQISREQAKTRAQFENQINDEKDQTKKHELEEERGRLRTPNLAIYDAQVVKDWRFYQALFPAFEGEVKDLVNQYTGQLCRESDISLQFKKIFCHNSNIALVFHERSPVKAQMIGEGVQAAFGAGTTLIKSFIDLAALFRTDTKIEGKSVTIDESALVAELFRALKNKYGDDINLYYPEVFHPRVTLPVADDDKPSTTVTTIGTLFLAKLEADRIITIRTKDKTQRQEGDAFKAYSETRNKLTEEKDKADALILELKNLRLALDAEDDPVVKKRIVGEIAIVKVKLDKLEAPSVLQAKIDSLDEQIKPIKDEIKALTAQIKNLTDLNERFQTFVDQFVKVDNNGVNALALFIKSEDIERALPEGSSYWLEIKSVSAGGSNRTRKNLLRYFSGAKVDHSGGIILEYTLYKRSGGVIYSDKLTQYNGYFEPKKIKDKLVDRVK